MAPWDCQDYYSAIFCRAYVLTAPKQTAFDYRLDGTVATVFKQYSKGTCENDGYSSFQCIVFNHVSHDCKSLCHIILSFYFPGEKEAATPQTLPLFLR